MAQPKAAGTESASTAPSAILATSTSSNVATYGPRKPLQHILSEKSYVFQHDSHNVSAQPPSTTTDSSEANIDANIGVNLLEKTIHSNTKPNSLDKVTQDQEEVRALQFTLAQQQMQQYETITKQLEAQSGIVLTPVSTMSDITSNNTSVAGMAKTSEALQKRRQEQLAKLQQNVQHQAAMVAQVVQNRSDEKWLRSKLLLEQENLRLLRFYDQQLQQQTNKGNLGGTTTATSTADNFLVQQQQVIRQQQLLQNMLQKQRNQQNMQLQLKIRLQKSVNDKTCLSSTPSKPSLTMKKAIHSSTPTYYSIKKRKLRSAFEMDLESLAKICIRVANARTDCEMRQALDKMTTWLHHCTELMLLQIAKRDYRDSLARRRPVLIQQNRWPMDLQAKSELITQKIERMLEETLLREKKKVAQQEAAAKVVVSTSVATTAASLSSSASFQTQHESVSVAANPVPASVASPPSSTVLSPAVQILDQRDIAAVEREYAELKAQLQARQFEVNQKAKAKRDAAKLEAFKAADTTITSAVQNESHKRPLQLVAFDTIKKTHTNPTGTISTASINMYRPPPTTVIPISPRVAQQFYDLDLVTRASTENDDKMYLPSKAVLKIMQRALQGDHEAIIATTGTTFSPTPNVEDHEQNHDYSIHVSEDAVTFMQECVTEFLLYFTSEARDLSLLQNRRTKKGMGLSISGANVVEGMDNLGFTSYARVLSLYNEKVKACQDAVARKKLERKKLIQQQAFEKAAAASKAAKAVSAHMFTSEKSNLGTVLSGVEENGVKVSSVNRNFTIARLTSESNNTSDPTYR
ncbi:histone-fold-containing protein [Plasmopara halstedii]|uniref:Histone-fold-containing protein n=1 Tax=Plasmopara halstedii TaxID=4781 RepID=A0A0P1B648_PLAHL|nr:histone-fold-containing protein [Plasmopara halstedii]CEG50014.1 histone-fold-containing protein [Plasmopara halstedii]|eukprot:XP_024586383.1 histone-fold-containing protein [Plasmopara halstedii]